MRRVFRSWPRSTSACSGKTPPPVGSPGQRHRQGARREQLAYLPVANASQANPVQRPSRPAPPRPSGRYPTVSTTLTPAAAHELPYHQSPPTAQAAHGDQVWHSSPGHYGPPGHAASSAGGNLRDLTDEFTSARLPRPMTTAGRSASG